MQKRVSKNLFQLSSLLFMLAILATTLFAKSKKFADSSWELKSDFPLNEDHLASLKKSYPSIQNSDQLSSLLKMLSRISHFDRIEVIKKNNHYIVTTKVTGAISEINFEVETNNLRNALSSQVHPYIGRAAYLETLTKLDSIVNETMEANGFFNAKLNKNIRSENQKLSILYQIASGPPCFIERVELFFELPEELDFDIPPGTMCKESIVLLKLDEMIHALEANHYRNSEVQLKSIVFNKNKTSAVVKIAGKIGRKITFEIQDDLGNIFTNKLFSQAIITPDELKLIDPDSMQAELKSRYSNLGYYDVKVKRKNIEKLTSNHYHYIYEVTTGTQYLVKTITMDGLREFDLNTAIGIMGLSSVWTAEFILSSNKINEAIDKLRATYQERGYWLAKIRYPDIIFQPNSNAVQLNFTVEEKEQRILDKININGNYDKNILNLEKIVNFPRKQPLSQEQLASAETEIKKTLSNQGFLYNYVNFELKTKRGDSERILFDLNIEIDALQRAKFGSVTIVGLQKTMAKVVLRELRFTTGEYYDPELVRSTRRALLNLGLFRSVEITPADPDSFISKSEILDLIITVQEGDSGAINFGPGYNLIEGIRFNSELSYSNLMGAGRRFTTRGQISEQQHQSALNNRSLLGRKISFSYIEPYIFDWPLDGQFVLRHEARVSPQNTALWELNYAGEVSLTHKFRGYFEGLSLSLFYGQKISLEEGTKEQKDFFIATGDVRIGETGIRLFYEGRDDSAWPTHGYLLEAELSRAEYALGGNLRFQKWSYLVSYYYPLLEMTSLAFQLSMTGYENVGRQNSDLNVLPTSERLSAGGTGSSNVRAFRYASLGPFIRHPNYDEELDVYTSDVSQKILGGSKRTVAKFEIRQRLSEQVGASLFLDSGNIFLSNEEVKNYRDALARENAAQSLPFQPSLEENISYLQEDLFTNPQYLYTKHAVSYGIAFSWLTPIGSASVSCGLPLHSPKTSTCENDPSYCFDRSKQTPYWYLNVDCNLDIGTKF
ncbi:MAG: BamA/TamA family outer membrane protein [Oligoflexales bacterium]|nr:BamA/TamA family outer membrane protein [Oligoflexales bacterium]